jgi:hypothetical protein
MWVGSFLFGGWGVGRGEVSCNYRFSHVNIVIFKREKVQ